MASFLVETYVRQGDRERFAAAVDDLRVAIEMLDTGSADVRHIRSYLVPNDEMGVHAIDADSADVVKRLVQLAGIEVERIVAAIKVETGTSAAHAAVPGPRSRPSAQGPSRDQGRG